MTNASWYLMRGSGVVTLILLSAVVVLGIATAGHAKLGQLPRFATPALHRSISLLAVVFLGIHVVTAIVDPYAAVRVVQIVLPLPTGPYPLWLGLGAVSLDVLAAVLATSLLRSRLSLRVWKSVHWLAYASWPLAFAHGLGIGTDAASPWFLGVAAVCAAAVGLATAWRLRDAGAAQPKHLGAPLEERAA
jgi:sulfoxide reductase heme-binding subunit YedZ